MSETKQRPQLGWTREKKLTVNGERVQSVNWHEGFVTLAAGQATYSVDTAEFGRFVSGHWDPHKSWYYL